MFFATFEVIQNHNVIFFLKLLTVHKTIRLPPSDVVEFAQVLSLLRYSNLKNFLIHRITQMQTKSELKTIVSKMFFLQLVYLYYDKKEP